MAPAKAAAPPNAKATATRPDAAAPATARGRVPRFRLLPLTIAAAALLALGKTADLWSGGRFLGAPAVLAETAAKPASGPPKSLVPPDVAKPAAAEKQQVAEAKPEAAKPGEAPKAAEAAKAGAGKPAEPVRTAEAPPKAAEPGPAAAPAASLANRDPASFSRAEIEVLQNLVQRREMLEQRGKEVQAREALLAAAEKRIEARLAELKQLEAKLKGIGDKRDEEEERRLRGLVKVYEAMKPADAAKIFQELDMPVLLDVAERMKEAKLAPVMAQMDPLKAKNVTVELAQRRDPAKADKPAEPPAKQK